MKIFLSAIFNHIVITFVLTAVLWIIGAVITNVPNFFAWDLGVKVIILVFTNAIGIATQAGLAEEDLL